MTNGLARASVRFRPASFAGSLVALLFSAAIITACGVLLQTGITAHVTPARYQHTPVVVAGDTHVRITVGKGDGRADVDAPLPERPRVDAALAAKIADRPGVASAVPDVSFPVQAAEKAQTWTGRPYATVGLDTASGTAALTEGRAPRSGEVVLDAASARAAHLATGDNVSLIAPGGTATYRVSGLAPADKGKGEGEGKGGGATVWFADRTAEALSGHPGTVDAIAVRARPGTTGTALADEVRKAVDGKADVLTGDARGRAEEPGLTEAKSVLTGLGGSFGGIAAMTAVFVVMGTVALAIGQRSREFALLRAIGATPRQIRRTVATEAMIVAPVAGALGILPGLALASWWFDQLVDRGAIPGQVSLDIGPLPMVIAIGVNLLSALIAGYVAARRPAKLRPSLALGEAAAVSRRPGLIRTALGLAAVAGGVTLAGVAYGESGDNAANTALGVVMCFLVAVALLGPPLAWLCTTVLGLPLRSAGASGSLAADNTRAHAHRLASAITPIAMVTAFCGVLVFLQSTIRHVADDHVRTGIVADHVLAPDASGGPGLPAATAERAARVPGVEAAVGVLRTGAVHRGGGALLSATALGVSGDPAALPRVLDLGVESGSIGALGSTPDTVALDASLARSMRVEPGDTVRLWLGDGTPVRPKLVATYGRGLGIGEILLPRAAVAGHVSAALDSQVLVRDAPGADHAAVARRLEALGTPPGTHVTDAAGFAAQADRNQELNAWANTVMAAVLGGFAAVAAANTLVMTVLDRRREVALLRLSGTTRRQVRDMMRWEALLVAATGLLVGGAIAWTTLVPITRGVTGSDPYVPPGTALPLAAATVLLALVATGLPTRVLLRRGPLAAGAERQ
ncbi:FtsX-like permease family protein [Streptomyces sp. UNOC14_S4]|uniref:FtsX-like permease family protein n=1 Tax=Streptomyces sp. UNOC14_S4 TaxID=2872340 RepID=UPI001E395C26|nr:ABC transporter permease [Streptomyces sp. UNOC14_S4]MCC3769007.1 ABC transporter permease [Streptomyces sp. UNOC14_S4]